MSSKRSALSVAIAALVVAGCTAITASRASNRAETGVSAYPPIGDFVEVDGRRVHYVQEGSGPDVVLIHGASGNVRDWTFRFVDMLTDRYRVTVFDRPGLGYTDIDPRYAGVRNNGAESPRAQAALLKKAADRIGLARPVVLGHSYGGAVAMGWALDHDPAAVVVVAGATQPWPGGLGPIYDINASTFGAATVVPLISAFAGRPLQRGALGAVFSPQDPPEGYLDYVGAPLTLRVETLRANARQVNTLRPHLVEMAPDYPALRLPVEIVHGTADDIVPIDVHSEPLSRQIPGANLERLAGVGHMPHHSRPDAVALAIDRAAERAGLR